MDDLGAKRLHDHPRPAETAKPWGLLLLLMAMTSIGPTTLNVVVPALPQMANRLASDVATVQLAITVYLLALASGQLVMGPLSDHFGRRPVVLAGLALTAAASVLAISVGTVSSLIVARVLQALGASAGIVVSRAIIRDLFDRNRAASMLGLVATVMVVVPTLGPLIGGLLETGFGWPAIFMFTAVTTGAVVIWAAIALPETRKLNAAPGARQSFVADLSDLARSAKFWGYVCAGAFGSAPRNIITGPGSKNLNMNFNRTVQLRGNRTMQIRMNVNNILNLANYSGVDTNVNSPTFGQIRSVNGQRTATLQTSFRF